MGTQITTKNGFDKGKMVSPLDFFKSQAGGIQMLLPKNNLTVERMKGLFMACVLENPDLQNCTAPSWVGAILKVSQHGLNPLAGECYLIPYNNYKKNCKEVQFQIGYKGLLMLARRSRELVRIYAHEVYEKDEFTIEYGLNENIHHVPCREKDKGKIIGAYAIAEFRDKAFQIDFLDIHEIERRSGQSKTGKTGKETIWDKWPEEMCKKTVLKHLCKMLPLSADDMAIISKDENVINYNENAQSPEEIVTTQYPEEVDEETGEIEEVTTDNTMVLLGAATVK